MKVVHARVAPKRDTTANWERHPEFVPLRGELIIYTDHSSTIGKDGQRVNVPALKVGDGRTPVGDLPFIYGGGGGGAEAWINGVPVEGYLTLDDLGIQPAGNYPSDALTEEELEELIKDDI